MANSTKEQENKDIKNDNEKKDVVKETGYRKILITAVITALLTSISQYFLQNSRLSGEQQYWKRRYEIETLDKINSQRLQLIDDISKDLLQLEVKAKEIKISTAASKYFTTPEEAKELTNLMVQYHKDLYLTSAKLQMSSVYFDHKVDSIIPILGEALRLNFQNNLLIEKKGPRLPEFDLDFETIDTLARTRSSLTKAMLEEISKSYELKNK